jgi:hypothetical protein
MVSLRPAGVLPPRPFFDLGLSVNQALAAFPSGVPLLLNLKM